MNEMQHNWIRERATKLESCRPQVALSPREQQAVDRIVGDAAVIALGDVTHGSKEVLHSRERLLRFLIQERHVSIIVIEACFAATRRLNDYLVSGAGTAVESLAATEYWSCLNRETLDFVNWIREHNLSRHDGGQPVRVYGCDLQSIDGPRTELTRLLRDFARAGRLASEDCLEAMALLDRLPSDRELFGSLEPLISEASSPNPDGAKIADIQARRTDYMSVRPHVCGEAGTPTEEASSRTSVERGGRGWFFLRTMRTPDRTSGRIPLPRWPPPARPVPGGEHSRSQETPRRSEARSCHA